MFWKKKKKKLKVYLIVPKKRNRLLCMASYKEEMVENKILPFLKSNAYDIYEMGNCEIDENDKSDICYIRFDSAGPEKLIRDCREHTSEGFIKAKYKLIK